MQNRQTASRLLYSPVVFSPSLRHTNCPTGNVVSPVVLGVTAPHYHEPESSTEMLTRGPSLMSPAIRTAVFAGTQDQSGVVSSCLSDANLATARCVSQAESAVPLGCLGSVGRRLHLGVACSAYTNRSEAPLWGRATRHRTFL